MISEAKIKIGDFPDEYLVLSITALDKLVNLDFCTPSKNPKARKKQCKVRVYWTNEVGGRSYLMVDLLPARALIDGLRLERFTDAFGSNHYNWV